MAKYSNFRDYRENGAPKLERKCYAVVDEEIVTGVFWWTKKTVKAREVFRDFYGSYWQFLDSGQFVPNEVDALARAYKARMESVS